MYNWLYLHLVTPSCMSPYRYRDRYWRGSVFKGVELVMGALDESYGVGGVSLVSAAYRWLNHHSQLSPEHGGELLWRFSIPCHFVHLKVKF